MIIIIIMWQCGNYKSTVKNGVKKKHDPLIIFITKDND